MIPKEAIERAIEGGWSKDAMYFVAQPTYFELAALDPSFWQALGKALGWRHENSRNSENRMNGEWIGSATNFAYLILTGGDTKAFWEELLAAR